ncbi:hypothetical protein KKF05_05915 [Patescibacteria group bacterium]|nr:hypothetical protein [Patescibacteria group bacterium]MBU1028693.1 hypothetical protein [Patescibacteria group bacterium]MBU1915698.1 hypothetical protein [Patescibacteria group bacterium]
MTCGNCEGATQELCRRCKECFKQEFPALSLAVLSDGTVVQMNGVSIARSGHGFGLAVRYHAIGRLPYWTQDIASIVGLPCLPEGQYVCEQGTVPLSVEDLGSEPLRPYDGKK